MAGGGCIDNAVVEVDEPEVPIQDGSTAPLVDLIGHGLVFPIFNALIMKPDFGFLAESVFTAMMDSSTDVTNRDRYVGY